MTMRHDQTVGDAVSSTAFREIMGSFPTGVTVITTRSAEGRPVGLTANAVSSVSLNPPQLLVCLGRDRFTAQVVAASKRFAVNFLDRSQQAIAERFASRADDKFAGLPIIEGELGLPLISGALAFAECRVVKTIETGDHLIFVGLVLRGEAEGGVPLMFFRRHYGEWPSRQQEPSA
ncbi:MULTISPECIES: flavin reductase family protein [unclassified Chelatococcus]|uniref:flavin reductase family protein n=1 Tax=unclassified Chelatococcus TaxID=2638111 RepID=UPI001BCE83A7|nr:MULTISPECIES: flavin reductase family protein [unclassified Chelatococcus]MBS7697205.1 flavin reductase family protein [Chelatococcus sp. YT9]MBX3556498.1 flavin reductase family protein [Chelatococcus sp.]